MVERCNPTFGLSGRITLRGPQSSMISQTPYIHRATPRDVSISRSGAFLELAREVVAACSHRLRKQSDGPSASLKAGSNGIEFQVMSQLEFWRPANQKISTA